MKKEDLKIVVPEEPQAAETPSYERGKTLGGRQTVANRHKQEVESVEGE